MRAINGDNRAHVNTRRLHVNQQKRNALLAFFTRAGAHQAENPIGVLCQCRPHFMPIDDIFIAFQHRFGFK